MSNTSTSWNSIKNTVSTAMSEIRTAVSTGMNSLKSTVSTELGSIRSSFSGTFSGLVSSAYSWGADICSQMASGIRANSGSVLAEARSLASQIDDIIGFSVPETGPLSHADEYMPDFMELLARGIKSGMGDVVSRVETVASRIRELMERIRPSEVALPLLNLPDFPKGGWGGSGLPDLAFAGNGGTTTTNNQRTINMGGIHLTVNGYNVQDDDQLATMVANKINDMMEEDNSVFK